jgi:hypothetical protein
VFASSSTRVGLRFVTFVIDIVGGVVPSNLSGSVGRDIRRVGAAGRIADHMMLVPSCPDLRNELGTLPSQCLRACPDCPEFPE